MSRKFLETESPRWVDQGVISAEQAQRLLALYPVDAKAIGLLPLLGSLLVALSALSLVAANWRSLPELVRLGILLGAMAGAYGSGEYFRRRGNDQLGIGLVGLGLILFGASIILVSQLYQLIGYDVTGLVAWAVAATALTYLYRSRFLFLLTVVIGAIVQGYNTEALGAFSYATAAFTALSLGYYWWKNPDALLGGVLAAGLLWQAGLLVGFLHVKITWFFVAAMAIYAFGDWQADRPSGRALQGPPLAAAFLFILGLAVFGEAGSYTDRLKPPLLAYLAALGVVFVVSLLGKRTRGRLSGATDWLLLLPGFYLPAGRAAAGRGGAGGALPLHRRPALAGQPGAKRRPHHPGHGPVHPHHDGGLLQADLGLHGQVAVFPTWRRAAAGPELVLAAPGEKLELRGEILELRQET